MTNAIATVDPDGRLVLPDELQRQLGLEPGSRVEVAVGEATPWQADPVHREAAARAMRELQEMFRGQSSLEDEYFRDRDHDKW